MKEIRFYRTKDAYGFFSNFSTHRIMVDGIVWPTVEHYFQASKFEDEEIKNKIRRLKSPMDAANEGRKRSNPLRGDWEEIKDHIMLKALKAKFYQHPQLKSELLHTQEATLIEATTSDTYWGIGSDNTGRNMLGKLLMLIRKELTDSTNDPHAVFPPWVAFPGVAKEDMFWRMGIGEDYLQNWLLHYTANEESYKLNFPEPPEWKGFYDE